MAPSLEANLMMDRETGRPRGFGFVTMSTPEEAQAAIDALNGKAIDGRALTVNVAKPREERSSGGGGGGGGRRMEAAAADRAADINRRSISGARFGSTRLALFILS